ncbi:hypothetical protein B0T11DRAFT_294219 [Plectosphaerella cucumerina]|uniref:Uncharacterized protein n=1 Tax=Plectosphaerella cucumerina TaxID=40658 RepID=A0A8K0TTN5_9PEZI|nr:hypothetical protein B0T11DRAFT_294219 [Plectosphaerella cucumerina]
MSSNEEIDGAAEPPPPPALGEESKKTRTKKIELSSNAQELEKARSEEETLFDSVDEAMQWMANNTILRPLERVKGPRVEYDGPPESHDDQVVVVRVTTAAIYNFSGEEQVDIPNPRNIQQTVQAKHFSNDDKVEKIIGSKYVAETKTMVELAGWRLLHGAIVIHKRGYEIAPWEDEENHLKPEPYSSFSARWAEMAKGLRTNKSLVKALVKDPSFVARFVLRPRAELKGKITNATLNGQKAKYIKQGRDVETPQRAGDEQHDEGLAQKKARK